MSHFLQYPQQHLQQQLQQVYPDKQQHQQKQSSPAMTYYNNGIQVSMTLGIPAASDASLEIAYPSYLNGLGLNPPASPSGSSSNLESNSHPDLIGIRRDSGFANSSLDEMSLGIMSSNGVRHGLKNSAHNQFQHSSALGDLTNLNSFSTTTSPSILVTSTTVEGSTPIVPSMSSVLSEAQRMYLVQQGQQQQQQSTASTPSPTSTPLCTAYSDSWAMTPVPTGLTAFPSSTDHSSGRSPYASNDLVTVYGLPQQQVSVNVVPSQQVQQPSSQQQSLLSPVQYTPKQVQVQRPRQRKPQLHIATDSELSPQMSMMGSSVDMIASGYPTPSIHWDQPSYDMTHCSVPASSPSMAAANNIVQANQQGYPWGFVSSPSESSLSSGASTPLFASPPSSYTHSEMATSCESSRAASPMTPHTAYDAYLLERRIKSEGSPSLSVHSRKSSTSSTSSMGCQRRPAALRGPTSPASPRTNQTSTSSPTHQCPKCGQCFAGPAVLVRHIESIHDKLLWNCGGCKSNLSRRDAVTRHINLSPMDSVCRAIGTIGQVKTSNGIEVYYEVSPYRAKPLDEVMSRMGKKISAALRKEIDRSKSVMQQREANASSPSLAFAPEGVSLSSTNMMMMSSPGCQMVNAMDGMALHSEEEDDIHEDGSCKKRRRSLLVDIDAFRKKK